MHDGRNVTMVVTSVAGHLMQIDFENKYRNWQSCDPILLFDAKINKYVPDVSMKKQTHFILFFEP